MSNQHTGEDITTKVAREYRIKFGVDMPTHTLSKVLYKENKSLYHSLEHARGCLRRIEGKKGNRNGKEMKDKSLVMERDRPNNPYKLPESEEQEIKPYIIPSKCTRILLLSDIHIPYHSIEALTLALDFGKEKKIDTIILNGDTIDFYLISRFQKDVRKRSIPHELEATRQFLSTLRQEFPQAHIIYKVGNHDARLRAYLMIKAPELLGIQEFELQNLLQLKSFNIDFVDDKVIMKLKALNILHGHEFGQNVFSPVNVARGLFLKANAIAIQGHNHQTSENTVTTLNGDMVTTWSTGCMCELQPDYLPYNKWNRGFAYIEVNGKEFEVFNKRIKGDKVF